MEPEQSNGVEAKIRSYAIFFQESLSAAQRRDARLLYGLRSGRCDQGSASATAVRVRNAMPGICISQTNESGRSRSCSSC